MNTKTLSNRALGVIDQCKHFKLGSAVCSIPYWNNKVTRTRAALRVRVGKGSPRDIFEEAQNLAVKNHVPIESLSNEMLKKMLVDENIGIDCSGFAYYLLNAESEEIGNGSIDKSMHFTNCRGIIGKIRAHFRPVENCSVATLADDKNSRVVPLKETQPGDIVTMLAGDERDHVLTIYRVDYQNFTPIEIHYVHATAYPEDGLYGSGVKEGMIEILDPEKSILNQRWLGDNPRIFDRAKNSKTEIRRLRWF